MPRACSRVPHLPLRGGQMRSGPAGRGTDARAEVSRDPSIPACHAADLTAGGVARKLRGRFHGCREACGRGRCRYATSKLRQRYQRAMATRGALVGRAQRTGRMATAAPWLLVAAVVLLVSGCGSSSTSSSAAAGKTRLRADVVSVLSVARTYSLRCDPAEGSATAPAAICAAIREQPRLLGPVGGREHSCPAGTPVVFVAGSSTGQRVDATFSACVSGQESLLRRRLRAARVSQTCRPTRPRTGASGCRPRRRRPCGSSVGSGFACGRFPEPRHRSAAEAVPSPGPRSFADEASRSAESPRCALRNRDDYGCARRGWTGSSDVDGRSSSARPHPSPTR